MSTRRRRPRSPPTTTSPLKNLLLKPALFTGVTIAGSFGVTTAIDRLNLRLPKWAVDMNQRTPHLWPFVGTVVLSNIAIFLMWQRGLPPRFLSKYFLSQHGMEHTFAMLGSTFSHRDLWHLGFNMFAFYSFSRSTSFSLGSGDTASMYLTCGVVSSWIAGKTSL
jgi:hypothetical protein